MSFESGGLGGFQPELQRAGSSGNFVGSNTSVDDLHNVTEHHLNQKTTENKTLYETSNEKSTEFKQIPASVVQTLQAHCPPTKESTKNIKISDIENLIKNEENTKDLLDDIYEGYTSMTEMDRSILRGVVPNKFKNFNEKDLCEFLLKCIDYELKDITDNPVNNKLSENLGYSISFLFSLEIDSSTQGKLLEKIVGSNFSTKVKESIINESIVKSFRKESCFSEKMDFLKQASEKLKECGVKFDKKIETSWLRLSEDNIHTTFHEMINELYKHEGSDYFYNTSYAFFEALFSMSVQVGIGNSEKINTILQDHPQYATAICDAMQDKFRSSLNAEVPLDSKNQALMQIMEDSISNICKNQNIPEKQRNLFRFRMLSYQSGSTSFLKYKYKHKSESALNKKIYSLKLEALSLFFNKVDNTQEEDIFIINDHGRISFNSDLQLAVNLISSSKKLTERYFNHFFNLESVNKKKFTDRVREIGKFSSPPPSLSNTHVMRLLFCESQLDLCRGKELDTSCLDVNNGEQLNKKRVEYAFEFLDKHHDASLTSQFTEEVFHRVGDFMGKDGVYHKQFAKERAEKIHQMQNQPGKSEIVERELTLIKNIPNNQCYTEYKNLLAKSPEKRW